ncbi:hypothetical protein [uncultured Thiodictyon sp.]|uniref:hypothetical protein n=1 Tax=uncultured Thiodictyon sp. TaxID=1846217 RepID=UPI0025EBD67B|nr:hypothetical protein [uncultured Thiodictyon sp.]
MHDDSPDGGTRDLQRTLARLERQARERTAKKEPDAPAPPAANPRGRSARPTSSGAPGPKVIAEANARLERFLRERGVEQFELFPSAEYPTPLTRLPLFPPIQRSTARELAAASDWITLESRWDGGGVFKAGPALTVYDEDTLFGLMNMRQQGMTGPADRLPIAAPPSIATSGLAPSNPVRVHALYCLISQLESVIQGYTPPRGWGGRAIAKRRESMDNLAAITLKFQKPKGDNAFHGKPVQLIFIEYVVTAEDACYYVQFHPLISQWLEEYRTFLDFDIRRQLSPLGKAMHRSLASQRSNRTFSIPLIEFFASIGAFGEPRDRKREAIQQLERLKTLQFLEQFAITGTGRRTPWVLEVTFLHQT